MTKVIDDWNYNEIWLLARCPEQVTAFERLLLTENDEGIVESELEKLLHQAQGLEVTATGLHQAFSNMWLSLEVWANDEEHQVYAEMIDDQTSYDDLEEFLLQLIDNYQGVGQKSVIH